MSGHSKWNNIKRKKEKTDAQKAKVFTKIGREIAIAVREGGSDAATNGKLRDLISKAKSLNVPNDNINRIIKRAEGGEKDNYEGIVYEGYGPNGIAVMVETLTDNRNRTAASMRHYFDKYGSSLGQSGSVAFMFTQQGVIYISAENIDEEKLMDDAFNAGADDFDIDADENLCRLACEAAKVDEVSRLLSENGYSISSAEAEFIPSTTSSLTKEDDLKKMAQLLSHLEEDDDVQNIWHSLENEEDLPEV
jgi:YebC/PmpR family DNA-binding regulatory protein